MRAISETIFSFFDLGNSKTKEETATPKKTENFYHAFVIGLIVDLKDRYEIRSNRESGYGRYDVLLTPKVIPDRGIVIEFKTFNPKKEKNLEETCKNALKQIQEKKYASELISRGLPSNRISAFAFAFEGKKVLIAGGRISDIDN